MGHPLLEREMRVRFGAVPIHLPDSYYIREDFEMSSGAFLFITKDDVRFHYELGRGITAQVPSNAEGCDFELFLWGTVFGAVAWLNGFCPLHASAVACQGRALAFTADSGQGKSTLAAALAMNGFAHVCDDTLVLATAQHEILAIPDGKPLKLWENALALTEIEREESIGGVPGKFYARAPSPADGVLPLTDLIFLERGETLAFEPITGSRKLDMLVQAMYRGYIHVARNDSARHNRFMLDITKNVRFWKLARPFAPGEFTIQVDNIGDLLRGLCASD